MSDKEYKSGIYQILNIVNGKRYIGSSSNLKKRLSSHSLSLSKNYHHNKHLQNAFLKYGIDKFEIKILLYCSIEDLIFFEQRAIDAYGLKNLYNIRIKAESNQGLKASEETRRKLSEERRTRKMSIEARKKMSEWHKGKIVSEETRKKLSEINKGKTVLPHTEETKKKIGDSHRGEKCYLYGKFGKENRSSIPIYQIDKNTNKIIKEWSCAAEAGRELKTSPSHISSVCNKAKHRPTAGGFKWSYVNENKIKGE
jgi:group I intron endonuclease